MEVCLAHRNTVAAWPHGFLWWLSPLLWVCFRIFRHVNRLKEYVSINIKSNSSPVILQHAKVKQLGDRTFVVGTPVQAIPILEQPKFILRPDKALVRWSALAEVNEMYEFDDAKGYFQMGGK